MDIKLQYISDGSGKTTGVFIPISDWIKLKRRYKGIEDVAADVPEWHKQIVRERMRQHHSDPAQAQDFDQAMNDIDKDL